MNNGPDLMIRYYFMLRLLQVKAPCNVDLRAFPFDTQHCHLEFQSLDYNTNKVILEWFQHPVAIMKERIELPDFYLASFKESDQTESTMFGIKQTLSVEFIFVRRSGYYILQVSGFLKMIWVKLKVFLIEEQ